MITPPVPSNTEIWGRLRELGFSETAHHTGTGRIWVHDETEQHLLVPNSVQGYYPDWIFDVLLQRAERISGRRVKIWPGWLPRPDNEPPDGEEDD